MNRSLPRLLVIAVIVALAAGAWYWWQKRLPPYTADNAAAPAQPAPPAQPAAAPQPAETVTRNPIEQAPAAAAATPDAKLPALEESGGYVTGALDDLLGRAQSRSMLQVDGFVRNAVATVDNLARGHVAPRIWPVMPTPGRFTVQQDGDRLVIGEQNHQRYEPFVRFVESVDTARAAALYVRLYPLFQRGYEELGYPGRSFNDRLVGVIDHLLATPEPAGPLAVQLINVKGPVEPLRPWVRYEYADPKLEALSSGQKILLRMGPDNARRVKAKLAEVRRQVAAKGR